MVLNVSEMEAKVREATNDDPWWGLFWCFTTGGAEPGFEGERVQRWCRKLPKGTFEQSFWIYICYLRCVSQDVQLVSPIHSEALSAILTIGPITASSSTKSCLVYIHGSWTRKRDNGERSIKYEIQKKLPNSRLTNICGVGTSTSGIYRKTWEWACRWWCAFASLYH